MDTPSIRDRWRGVATWLDASPAEVAGLAALVAGALCVLGLLWWTGRPLPAAPQVAGGLEDPVPGHPDPDERPVGADVVTVHVAGAVATPGLVRLPVGARVADAVGAAGGALLDADPTGLNLARALVDGERVDVPRLGDPQAASPAGPAAGGDHGAVRADGTLDLNRATTSELEDLPGVGPVLAQRILDWREANGPFTEVGQLRAVSGIGEKTFQALATLVAV